MLYTSPLLLFSLSFLLLSHAQQLAVDEISPISLNASTPAVSLSLPSSNDLKVSIALCTSTQPFPSFTVNNIPSKDGKVNSFSIRVNEGVGMWQGQTTSSSSLDISVENGGQGETWSLEVGISEKEPLHRTLSLLPQLGDTTSTEALLLSPPFLPPTHVSPGFPNYTLPGGNISWPSPPAVSSQPNFTLVFAPTSQISSNLDPLISKSACAIVNAARKADHSFIGTNSTGGLNGSIDLVLPNYKEGWQFQWLLEGLSVVTNYTAWILQDEGGVAGPIFTFTKSSSFPCTLAHSLPFCPQIAYSIPLPPPSDGSTTYSSGNLPSSVAGNLISSISNFTIALLTFPCGRDIYSIRQTCEDCADAYRTWACAVSFPRCGELPPSLTLTSTSSPTSKGSKATPEPTPALLRRPVAEGRANLSSSAFEYTELLPCLETCHAVDRSCPPFFGWSCPLPAVNANWSYGVGFIDSFGGQEGEGHPGVAQDRWGVSWCNG